MSIDSNTPAVQHAAQTLTINATRYEAHPIPPCESGVSAVRLVKLGGKNEVYDLCRQADGYVLCDCPNFLFVHAGTASQCKHIKACMAAGLLDTPEEIASLQAELDAEMDAAAAREFREWADAMDRAHAEEVAACGSAYDDAPSEMDDLDAVTAEDRDFWAAESDRLARIEAMATYYAELGEAEYESIREESYRSGLAFSDDADFELGEAVEVVGHLAYRHRTEG